MWRRQERPKNRTGKPVRVGTPHAAVFNVCWKIKSSLWLKVNCPQKGPHVESVDYASDEISWLKLTEKLKGTLLIFPFFFYHTGMAQ